MQLREMDGKEKIIVVRGSYLIYRTKSFTGKGVLKGCTDSSFYTREDTVLFDSVQMLAVKGIARRLFEFTATLGYYGSWLYFGAGVALYAYGSNWQQPIPGLVVMAFAKIPMEIARYFMQKDYYAVYETERLWKLGIKP